MATYTQAHGPLAIVTPLGRDVLLVRGLDAREGISQLFHLHLDLVAERDTAISFDQIIGEAVTVEVHRPDGSRRCFNGIVSRFTQGARDQTFTHFQAEIVPRLWLLTRNVQSRVFPKRTVPDILKEVLVDLRVRFDLLEQYDAREYCVQYGESDFAFASRLMEEEGIYYFFTHDPDGHTMVVSDATHLHPDVPEPRLVPYLPTVGWEHHDPRVTAWEKTQELRAGRYTLRDHCFEMPSHSLEARQRTLETVKAGEVTHRLAVAGNERLEIFGYPGGYAHRFDGVDQSGAERPQELNKIRDDGNRTVRIRMEQEITRSVAVSGESTCQHFASGHVFTLARHVDADGSYLLTRVEHRARCDVNQRHSSVKFEYSNRFACIPAALPYRPLRETPRPTIAGTQTATVVGPPGQEIFCDKYGRIRVQFHWDRLGTSDPQSSCWIRVAQPWAGAGFGAIAIPRVGHEVVVGFLEGNPDQPLVIGSVYNFAKMPPFSLPQQQMMSGIKSTSVGGYAGTHFSGLVFNDTLGEERAALYAERDLMVNAERDHVAHVGRNSHDHVGRMKLESVGGIPGIGNALQDWKPVEGGVTSATTDSMGNAHQPSEGNWKTSNGLLSAQPGMAGAVVYGVNSQDTVGFMHQFTCGTAYQVCVNPFGYFGFIENQATATGGSLIGAIGAVGGNVQMTFGTNTQAVYGPNISINHGEKIEHTGKPSAATYILGTLAAVLTVAYDVGFACAYKGDDDSQASSRAELYAARAALIPLLNAALLGSETADRALLLRRVDAAAKSHDKTLIQRLSLANSGLLSAHTKRALRADGVSLRALKPELPLTLLDDANEIAIVDGTSRTLAKQIELIAARDPAAPSAPGDSSPSTIYINAMGDGRSADDGVVIVNGTRGVALTASSASLIEMVKDQTTIEAGSSGKISIRCGVAGPEIALGARGITLQAGPSTIDVTPEGITLDAINITTNARIKYGVKAQIGAHDYGVLDMKGKLTKLG